MSISGVSISRSMGLSVCVQAMLISQFRLPGVPGSSVRIGGPPCANTEDAARQSSSHVRHLDEQAIAMGDVSGVQETLSFGYLRCDIRDSGCLSGCVIDQIVPLKRGGADAGSNMQWQTMAEAKAKDGSRVAGE